MFDRFALPALLIALLGIIAWLSMRLAQFSQACSGDGCMGGVVLLERLCAALALQLLILVPVFALSRRRQGRPVAIPVLAWIVTSLGAGYIPMLLVGR